MAEGGGGVNLKFNLTSIVKALSNQKTLTQKIDWRISTSPHGDGVAPQGTSFKNFVTAISNHGDFKNPPLVPALVYKIGQTLHQPQSRSQTHSAAHPSLSSKFKNAPLLSLCLFPARWSGIPPTFVHMSHIWHNLVAEFGAKYQLRKYTPTSSSQRFIRASLSPLGLHAIKADSDFPTT